MRSGQRPVGVQQMETDSRRADERGASARQVKGDRIDVESVYMGGLLSERQRRGAASAANLHNRCPLEREDTPIHGSMQVL